jgi:hypothetical protein
MGQAHVGGSDPSAPFDIVTLTGVAEDRMLDLVARLDA